jgi:hypothetical protein
VSFSFSSFSAALTSFFQSSPVHNAAEKPSSGFRLWGTDGFSFSDVLDIVNPLQHLPVLSTVYRALTGDRLAPAPRILGDALFGGPIGAAVGAANALLEYASGKDAGEHVLALLHAPNHSEDEPVQPANYADPVLSAPALRAAQAQPAQQAALHAADHRRRMTALHAYAQNSRLLHALERQGTSGVRL